MNSRRKRRMGWVLATAVAALGIGGAAASPAMAQYRVGNDGRALDANNRIGSGGINDAPARGPIMGVGGNQIVTGNVTGGQQFRGFVPYTDPFAFRGATAGINSDRFIRESSGVPIAGVTPNDNASAIRPFYGFSQTVERPPGYTLEAPGTGFVPAPRLSREAGDLRLGRTFDTPATVFPQPGQLILPGPVDPASQQPTVITASPLYGVRQWNFQDQADQQFLQGLNVPPAQRARLDERTIQRLRDEMNRQISPDAEPGMEDGVNGEQQRDRVSNTLQTPQLGFTLNDPAVQDRVTNRLQTEVRPGNLSIPTPERQSAQYAEMQRRMNRFNQLPEAVAQWREYQLQQARQRGEDQAQPTGVAAQPLPGDERTPGDARAGQPGAGAAPGMGTDADAQARQPGLPDAGLPDYRQRSRDILEGRGLNTDDITGQTDTQRDAQQRDTTQQQQPGVADATRPQPLQVSSLATGVQTKAVADFLKEAESLMREGKFYSALDQYEMADQVTPNDPMVNLGRAIAELGASYYGRADQHLREAFTRNPALLMAQYDLRGLLGQERLEFLEGDLRAISHKEANEPRSVFLLSFIHYNIGNPQRAAAYLDLAERRAGRPDPLYQNMRKYWGLGPAQAPAAEPNK